MGPASEREFKEKLNKILTEANKKGKDIRERFSNLEQIKVETLKKVEEMKRNADKDLDKALIRITKSKDLVTESKERLQKDITDLRKEVEEKYTDLKKRISETLTPKP